MQYIQKLTYKKYLILLLSATFFISLISPHRGNAANEFNYSVSSVYRVNSNGNTRVEDSYTITNTTSNQYLEQVQLATAIDDAKNIAVEYTDGTSIPFTTQQKTTNQQGYIYTYTEITVQFSRPNVGRNNRWSFILSYSTDKLVETKGSAHTVNIPAVPQENDSQYTTTLYVPEDFGTLHTRSAMPTSLGTARGEAVYKYENKTQLAKSAALVFGDSTIYNVNFNFPLNNTSSFNSTYTITLPPSTSGQKVVIESLNPEPKSTRLDVDGNILADYEVPANTNITVTTKISAIVSYIDYNLAASGTKADLPKDLVNQYTGAQQYWPVSNASIATKAQELTRDKKTVAEQVRAINDYVISHLTYNNEKIKYNIRQGGIKALQNPENVVCLEYSDLTISLLRAAGIPARMPVGYGYSGSLKQSNSVTDSLHSWVQVYVPNIGWMNLDPTWGEKFNNFGSSDLDHFAFAIWGVSDNGPAAVTKNGKDINYQYENTTIEYKATPPILQPSGKLSVTKWLILPFVGINRYSVQAPDSSAGDNFAVRVRQGSQVSFVELGKLAPKQSTQKYAWVIGATAFGNVTAEFAQSSDMSTVIATSKVATTQWPMWLLITIFTLFIAYKVVKSRFNKQKNKQATAKPIPTIKTSINNDKQDK